MRLKRAFEHEWDSKPRVEERLLVLIRSVSSRDASTPKNSMIRRKGMSQENPKPAASSQSILELKEGGWEFRDGLEEEIGLGGAEALLGGERAEDGDGGAYAGAAGHLEVFRGVTDVNAVLWVQGQQTKGEAKRGGMWFAETGIAAANAGGEVIPESEFAKLAVDAVAVAAGDEPQSMAASKLAEHTTCAGKEFGPLSGVVLAPDLVGGVVFRARKIGGAIDVVPVGRIVPFEFGEAPGNLHFSEHGQVRGGVGGIGIQERAVPVEEDAFEKMRVAGFRTLCGTAFRRFSLLQRETRCAVEGIGIRPEGGPPFGVGWRVPGVGAEDSMCGGVKKSSGGKPLLTTREELRRLDRGLCAGTLSSRSNSSSSKEAAIPNQPGMAAGSRRVMRALLTMTTLPRPMGRLTRTTSNSTTVPRASLRGHRKKTPVELMSRVTRVIGKIFRAACYATKAQG